MKKHFLLFFLLTISNALLAQNVTGLVVDEEGTTLIGANVMVKGTVIGNTTDLDGKFSFNYEEGYPFTLVVSYIGFSSKEMEITAPTSDLTIELTEGLLIGEEIVISASRKREKIQEAPASISVIGARKLAGSPQIDPVRNLINVAGVQIQQQSAARINIELRGGVGLFTTSAFPIMDYRSLVGPGIGTFGSLGINRIDIERMEVVRGPGSALYGPGVTTGVIHFITKNPIDHPGTTIEVGGGEGNTLISTIRHARSNKAKTFGYKINASYSRGDEFTLDTKDPDDAKQIALFKTEIFDPAITNNLVDLSQPGRSLLTQNDLDPDGDGNMMRDYWSNAFINTTLEFRPQDDLSFTFSGGMNAASSIFYNNLGEGLAQPLELWSQAKIQKGGLFAQLFYVNSNNGGRDNKPTFLYQTGLRTTLVTEQIEGQLQYNFQTPSFLNADWTTGIDYRQVISDSKNLTYGRQEAEDDYLIFGGYLQGKLPLGDKLDIFAAARLDQVNIVEAVAFSPRLAAVFKASPKHTFRASFNRAVDLPSALDVYIDLPLNVPVPGLFDVWYSGLNEAHEFAEVPMIDVTLPGAPDIPYGTPGLPLSIPFQAINADVLALLEPEIKAVPELALVAESILTFLRNYNPTGVTGELVGINVLNGQPLSSLRPTTKAKLTYRNVYEIGYKGLLMDKLSMSADVYHIRTEGARSFTALAPLMTLQGANIAEDLGNTVGADFNDFFVRLLTPFIGAEAAENSASQVTPAIIDAYQQGGQAFVDAVPAPLLSDIFGAVETSRMPMNDGIVHVPVGILSLEDASANYWGMDISTEYYINTAFSVWANYSWVGDVKSKVDNNETTRAALSSLGNTPRNKYRLGFNYTPINGIRANVSFQHNDGFFSSAGQFSGEVPATNLIDSGLGYQWSNGITLDLTATNLLNTKYRALPNMPKIGRGVIARMSYTFGGDK